MSIGNVGQLAVDLVVSSISPNYNHIGYFYDSCILPVVGNDAFTQSTGSLGKLDVSTEGLLLTCYIIDFATRPLCPASLTPKNAQRCKIIHEMHTAQGKDQ